MNPLLDFFFPKRCAVCHQAGLLLCNKCFSQLKLTDQKCPECCRPSVDGITHHRCQSRHGMSGLNSLWCYRQPEVRRLIREVKYKFSYEHLQNIFDRLKLEPLSQIDLIIPLPLHIRRQNWRGFNQAEIIAEHLSKEFSIPTLNALIKNRSTKQLAGLKNVKDRKNEIKGAFAVVPEFKTLLKGKTLLLVDDVFTSGSTMKEATKILKRNGAILVYGWTLAN